MIKEIIIFAVLYLFISVNCLAQKGTNADSLIHQLELTSHDSVKADIYDKLLWFYRFNNTKLATAYGLKALKFYQEHQNISKQCDVLNKLGIVKRNTGEYAAALDNYFKTISIAVQPLCNNELAYAYNNISDIYIRLEKYDKALEYIDKAYPIFQSMGNNRGIAYNLKIKGNIYYNTKEWNKAISYYKKSLDNRLKLENEDETAISWLNIGECYMELNLIDSAMICYITSLDIFDKLAIKDVPRIQVGFGKYYAAKKDYNLSIHHLKQAVEMAKRTNSISQLQRAYDELHVVYSEIKDFSNAYKIQTLAHETEDSIQKSDYIRKITTLDLNYQFDQQQKLKEIEDIKISTIYESEIYKQKLLTYGLIVLVIAIALIAFIVFKNYFFAKKTNLILKENNEKILLQGEELKTINDKLVELDHFKEGMTGMIVHDLKNPLNSILNNDNPERIKQAGKQMLNMVMNILDVQKFEDVKMKLELRNTQAFKIADNAYNQVKMLINEKNITFENQINQLLGIKTDSEILERVFVNLLTNAIKYTPNNGKIFIMNELMNEKMNDVKPDFIPSFFHSFILFKVSDTGQGIPADKLHLVFEKFGQVEAKKSGGIRSTGLGLTFCKLAIEAHGGKIGVESEVDIGTTFWFTIPLGTEIENTNFVEVQQTKAETFGLSDEDKQILLPLLSQFKKLEVYEVSDIRNLLKNIDIRNNPNLQFWVEEMKNIVRAGNEENYAALINLIENGKI